MNPKESARLFFSFLSGGVLALVLVVGLGGAGLEDALLVEKLIIIFLIPVCGKKKSQRNQSANKDYVAVVAELEVGDLNLGAVNADGDGSACMGDWRGEERSILDFQ